MGGSRMVTTSVSVGVVAGGVTDNLDERRAIKLVCGSGCCDCARDKQTYLSRASRRHGFVRAVRRVRGVAYIHFRASTAIRWYKRARRARAGFK